MTRHSLARRLRITALALLATVAGCEVLDVLRVLPALELAELVEWTGEGWRLAPRSRGDTAKDARVSRS